MTRVGLPHSEITGSTPACGSPMLIAACYVLHRLSLPRHPPSTLSNLTIKCLELIRICAFSTSNTYRILFTYPMYSIVKDTTAIRFRINADCPPQGRPSPPILLGATAAWSVHNRSPLVPISGSGRRLQERRLVELNGIEPMTS